MNKYAALCRIIAVLANVTLVLGAYSLWARPFQLRWGATDEEVQRPIPGDELNLHPAFLSTRAISINGTPEQIWPWLIQMGYKRAGFYGYDIFENLGSPTGIESAQRTLPEFQHFKVGDQVPISPAGSLVFYAIEPNRYLVWSGDAGWGGFTWALYPMGENSTRLVSRIRWSHDWSNPSQLAFDLFTEFADHLAIRKILYGVKGRVEGSIEPIEQTSAEFAIYLATALTHSGALVLQLLRPLNRRRFLAGLAAGANWLVIWYAPVPVWIGVITDLVVLWGLAAAFRDRPSRSVERHSGYWPRKRLAGF